MSVGVGNFSETSKRAAFGRDGWSCAGRSSILHVLLSSIGLWVVLMGISGQVNAGCHSLGEDWYRDYHHGHQINTVWDLVKPQNKWQPPQSFVYEDGEMRAISNPLPPRCQGPQCQESPSNQNLDGFGIVDQQRNLTFAMRSSERTATNWPVPSSGWVHSNPQATLAGFPASLEEPPR